MCRILLPWVGQTVGSDRAQVRQDEMVVENFKHIPDVKHSKKVVCVDDAAARFEELIRKNGRSDRRGRT